jgi:hypothetical protein
MASVTLRLAEIERAEWTRQANLAGLSLSEWIRKRCANGHNNGVRPADPASLDQRSASAPERAAGDTREPEAIPRSKNTCVHGKRKGFHCWQCGGLAKVQV